MAKPDTSPVVLSHPTETANISDLKPHPRNYRAHPEDQVDHIERSLLEHGQYRNVVVSQDGTILAGHGVIEAAKRIGVEQIQVIRLPLGPDDPKALKILTGDNETGRLADIDDRLLSEILKEVMDVDDLLGTGYNEQMLATLVYVTRDADEIVDEAAAAQWVGLPGFEEAALPVRLIISFDDEAGRVALLEKLGIDRMHKKLDSETSRTWMTWWPPREREDLASLRFEEQHDDVVHD